jgi:hypothetical protein
VTRTLLAAICSGSACQLQAPRALNRITLESGTLVRTAETGVVQLSAGLRNRADFAVQMPALELTLTDELGRVVVRKVLLPQQLVVRPEPMAAQAETAIDVRLAVGDLPLAGFQIDVFYP